MFSLYNSPHHGKYYIKIVRDGGLGWQYMAIKKHNNYTGM